MAKPWARYQQNYINHQKFLALSPAAICLWLEGKNYCDMHMTDGLIPREALKTFRFGSRPSVDALLSSAGEKADGAAWAPLWEKVGTVGFKMHDYLDHNDCRDAVMSRIEQGDKEKAADRVRKQHAREAKKEKARPPDVRPDISPDTGRTVPGLSCSITETETPTERTEKVQEPRTHAPVRMGSGVMGGSLPRDHMRHKVCGRICLHENQFEQFVKKLGGLPDVSANAVKAWAEQILETWELPPLMNQPIQGNTFQWWDARWIEWQGAARAQVSTARTQPEYSEWHCPHTPHCDHRKACAIVASRTA